MIVHYAITCSLRKTSGYFNAGYRSLQRHLEYCIPLVMAEEEQKGYERDFAEVALLLWLRFQPPFRRKSIIKKKVEFTWSRRAWMNEGRNKSENT
jgi:hypothetical protein